MKKKTALVIGAGGFIGSHMVRRLKDENYFVRGVDLKEPEFNVSPADEFIKEDIIINPARPFTLRGGFDEVYQFAANMGGAGYIFSGDNDADIFSNSMQINVRCAEAAICTGIKKFFFSSSACVYPIHAQDYIPTIGLQEKEAIPANPDSIYGWEKLAAEQMYDAYRRNYKLDVRIARFHNIFGPEGTYTGGREKAPAAICRKVAEIDVNTKPTPPVEIWGDGLQTRSFLYIDECIEGVRRMMHVDVVQNYPVLNIGSSEMVSINDLAIMVMNIAGKQLTIKNNLHVDTLGVRGRNSDNRLIKAVLDWEPTMPLSEGLEKTYKWIHSKVNSPWERVPKNQNY